MNDEMAEMIVAEMGRDNIRPNSKMDYLLRQGGVVRTFEFRRIEALPRRRWEEAADLEELTRLLTWKMLLPNGADVCGPPVGPPPQDPTVCPSCRSPRSLKQVQAAALRDIHDVRGGFLPVGVGRGKTIMSLLAPVVLGAARPLLIVPADLREKTLLKSIPTLSRHWRMHPNLRVISYTELSFDRDNKLLAEIDPDLIIMDECHEVKNLKAGRSKKLHRWLDQERRGTIVVAMSGTMTTRSLKDYHHLARWTLKEDLMPLPNGHRELCDWADALDEGIDEDRRMAPGALSRLCATGEAPRVGYQRRLTETPGVVASSGVDGVTASLIIRPWSVDVPRAVAKAMQELRDKWELPDGNTFAEAIDLWRHMRSMSCGYWQRWDPPAPLVWLDARREWKRYVRHTLTHNRRELDTELMVWNECALMNKPPAQWVEWKAVKDTFDPVSVPEWVDDTFAAEECGRWLVDSDGNNDGIIWVESPAFGERISEVLKLPYLGAGKQASRNILEVRGPIIASINAHKQGKDLQDRWWRNLVTASPTSGKLWEQMAGRTHRDGQPADRVVFDVFTHAEELVASFRKACGDARYIEDTFGNHQKLNFADIAIEI